MKCFIKTILLHIFWYIKHAMLPDTSYHITIKNNCHWCYAIDKQEELVIFCMNPASQLLWNFQLINAIMSIKMAAAIWSILINKQTQFPGILTSFIFCNTWVVHLVHPVFLWTSNSKYNKQMLINFKRVFNFD